MKRICYCNITYQCNNSCEDCISYNVKRHTHREVTLEDYRYFQNVFKFGNCDTWTISGGEPTLSDSFSDIIDFCHSISPHIIVYTNGRNLSNFTWNTIAKIERFIVPLYGNEKIHNEYVKSSNAYKETMNSIQRIISRDTDKVDIKLILQEDRNTESLFCTGDWACIKENKNFSVTRLITKESPQCSNSLAFRADCIIQELMGLKKNVRFYDIPFCMLTKDLQLHLSKMPLKKITNVDTTVICGSSQQRYKLFFFNKRTDCKSECKDCCHHELCSMIMQNYFCPMITGSEVCQTTE